MLASSNVSYGVIPNEHWYQPEWIDEERASAGRNKLVSQNIIYGGRCVLAFIIFIFSLGRSTGSVS